MTRAAILAVALASCGCAAPGNGQERPAVLAEPSAETRAELRLAVSAALNGADVMLADDALTKDSRLVVERRHLKGRELDRPEQFRLVMIGTRCLLVHEPDGERREIPGARCVPE